MTGWSGAHGLTDGVCACGERHEMRTKSILVGRGAVGRLGEVLAQGGLQGRALVVADENTDRAGGAAVARALGAAGVEFRKLVLPGGELHVDERTVGSVLMALDDGTAFLVAVGSGTINDTCRFVARRTGLPYAVVGTAPSMDGYASDVTPVVRAGLKITFPGVAPAAIVGDTDLLRTAPARMAAAGVGDMFGKYTALTDWQLAHRLTGEYHCEAVAGLVRDAVDTCMAAAHRLPTGDPDAIEGLMNGLVLSGVAMQLVGNSRPASGAEHHLAHFWEMRDMERGRKGTLHGEKVGMAELIVLRLYEKFFAGAGPAARPMQGRAAHEAGVRRVFGSTADSVLAESSGYLYHDDYREAVLGRLREHWGFFQGLLPQLREARVNGEAVLRSLGGAVRPAELGYGREDLLDALRYAMELRERFTVLRLAALCGVLDGLAEELGDEFC